MRSAWARKTRWGLGLLCALGCTGEGSSGETWVLLGSGETTFEAVAEGGDVDLEAGAQGGWHLWVSARADGFGARATLHTRIEPVGWDGPAQEGWRPVRLARGDGFRVHVGSPAVLSYAACFVGRPTRVTLTLTADDGRQASDEAIWIPRASPTPPIGDCDWIP